MNVSHGLKMNLSRREIRVLLLHKFRLSHRATESTNNTCSTIDDHVISIRTAQHWFNRFKNGTLKRDDLQHSGRTLALGVDLPKQHIEEDLRLTSRYLAEQFGCSHTMVEKHLIEWIRQDMEIWSFDIAWVIITSIATQSWCLYEFHDISSQLSMVSESYLWRWELDVVH